MVHYEDLCLLKDEVDAVSSMLDMSTSSVSVEHEEPAGGGALRKGVDVEYGSCTYVVGYADGVYEPPMQGGGGGGGGT